jgi:chemotaxis protein histidine kinase CheA
VIRRVRRAVHTMKGDSAACGFHKLVSSLTNSRRA